MSRVDSHVHIIDPARFPFARAATIIPAPSRYGTAHDLAALHAARGIDHALLVQPSCYGFDNAAMLDALAQAGRRWAGIAVVPMTTNATDMRELAAQGVIGVRFNLVSFDPEALADAAIDTFLDRCDEIGWWVEVLATSPAWAILAERFRLRETRLLIDHFGTPNPSAGLDQPGFRAILDLAQCPRSVVKLSAPYRISQQAAPYADLAPYVTALNAAYGPARMVWGSDWPFINFSSQPTYASLMASLTALVSEDRDREAILGSTPMRLFGLGSSCCA